MNTYIYSFKEDLDLSQLWKNCSWDIRWVQNPLTNKNFLSKGFYGFSTKTLDYSSQISSINVFHTFNCNCIKQKSINRNEETKYGLVLIHHCSRSLIDFFFKKLLFKNKWLKNYRYRDSGNQS